MVSMPHAHPSYHFAADDASIAQPHVLPTYGRVPIALVRGAGCRVWDAHGREYLDALGGIAVNTLGHAHPRLVAALQEQVAQLIHVSNYYHIPQQEELAAMLCDKAAMQKAFFCNSGLEANEAAIKIARKFAADRGVQDPAIVVLDHAFHGRSIATMTATANPKVREGFGALPEHWFIRAPVGDVAAIEAAAAAEGGQRIAAVMLEPVQGEGGLHPMPQGYLSALRRLCDARGWLLMFDEVQSGMGRTGRWFAHQWADAAVPDVMSLAKGLGSGVPVGAVLVRGPARDVLQKGNHGSTFGGNPLAMRAGVETVRIMEDEKLLDNVTRVGAYLQNGLRRAFAGVAAVREVRGQGLMVGVELDRNCEALIARAAQAGLLISVTAHNVIRLVPPLNITPADADAIVERLHAVVLEFVQNP